MRNGKRLVMMGVLVIALAALAVPAQADSFEYPMYDCGVEVWVVYEEVSRPPTASNDGLQLVHVTRT